jgi:hypothetical protein
LSDAFERDDPELSHAGLDELRPSNRARRHLNVDLEGLITAASSTSWERGGGGEGKTFADLVISREG